MPLSEIVHDIALQHEDDDFVERLRASQENDIKQVRVHSSAMNVAFHGSAPFTVYTLIATCPGTKAWWVLKKRYSQFFSIRKRLAHLFNQHTSLPEIASLLAPVLEAEFPKKHLLVSVKNKAIIKERKAQLQVFTAVLVAVRAGCVVTSIEHHADQDAVQAILDEIYDLLDDFLEVPHHGASEDHASDTSLSSPEMQLLPQTPEDLSPTTSTTEENESRVHDGVCSICLCDLSMGETSPAKKVHFDVKAMFDEDTVLRLPCGHCFHEECVMYWVEQKNSCPLCRAAAFDGIVI
ncbi:hypothetical protein ACHHYP_03828 [Achlya hypogyna]|uniref:RING-type domain-containing protein n=1 Tax=Achlya hypogyna TaxID=1202772 RepID=A0A1V9Z2T0_ACHHY|nr:hypothetical protein ACHHYP_03828 [Achlya hypogyna]